VDSRSDGDVVGDLELVEEFPGIACTIDGLVNTFLGIEVSDECGLTKGHTERIAFEEDAEKIAILISISIAASSSTTVYFLPEKTILLPADLADATGINSVTGKFLSAKTCNITFPTIPVAPTTATFIIIDLRTKLEL
jgi:hypothetical protein